MAEKGIAQERRTEMKIVIHRGSREIGGSCVEVESRGQRLLVDIGLPLDAEGDPRQFLPQVKGLDGSDPSLLGILISHPHQDHFGLLSEVAPTIKTGMGAAARRILTAAGPFMPNKYSPPPVGWDFEHRMPITIGPFTVTPYLVDHAAFDSYALLIEADGKRLFYSGDFRAHGRKSRIFQEMIADPPKDVDVLLMEGTSLGRLNADEHFPSEQELEQEFAKAFSATKGVVLVQCSAQNIDRVVSVFRACKRTGRTLVIDLYAAAILAATGNKSIPQSAWPQMALLIPQSQRVQIKNNAWFDLLNAHAANRVFIEDIREAPEKGVILFRSLHCRDLERSECLKDSLFIYSQWIGYWEDDSMKHVRALLERHKIPRLDIHTSGHASPADLQKFVAAMKPGTIVPIHSLMPERYQELFPNVAIHHDGEQRQV